MSELVAGFCMPHNPLMVANPKINAQESADAIYAAFDEVNKRIKAANVDTVIVIGDDHYYKFGPQCLPQFLIAIGDVDGPQEPWLGLERYAFENNTRLAEHIMDFGLDRGFDWAVAKSITLDHGTMVPVHLGVKPLESGIRAIPIYIASGVLPMIRRRRAHELGKMIGQAIASAPGNDRVAIFGTGGISHWVGESQMGRVNIEFDKMVLDHVHNGDTEALIALSDAYIDEYGGNGAHEIRNWLVAMGAMGSQTSELLCYEAIPEWINGVAVAELKRAA